MADLTRLRRAFNNARRGDEKRNTYRAKLGDNNRRLGAGRTNYVWARVQLPEGLAVTEVLCINVAPSLNAPVLVAYNVNDQLEVVSLDPVQGPTYYGELPGGNVGPHAWSHGRLAPDAMRIDPLQINGLLVTPTDPPSTAVKLGSWFYQTSGTTYDFWPSGTVDLSGYIPTEIHEQRPVIVGYDRTSRSPQVIAGTAGLYVGYTPYQIPFNGSDVAMIIGTAEFEAAAAVRLRYAMGTVENYDIFLDCRRWVGGSVSTGGGGSSGPQNNFSATSNPDQDNDNTEGYAVGSEWINTTNDNYYKCTDASTGAAVWYHVNKVANSYVYNIDIGANYTLNQSSFTDVDATNLSFSVVVQEGSRGIDIWFNGVTFNSTTNAAVFLNVSVNGTDIVPDDGIVFQYFEAGAVARPTPFNFRHPLTAGTYTVRLRYKVSGGTSGVMYGGNNTGGQDIHSQFGVKEWV